VNVAPPNIFWDTPLPLNDRTRGNGGTVAFNQIGLRRNAKSMANVNSSFTNAKCLVTYVVIYLDS